MKSNDHLLAPCSKQSEEKIKNTTEALRQDSSPASFNQFLADDDMIYPDNHLDDDERYYLFPGADYDD